jgi:hypothetical protein
MMEDSLTHHIALGLIASYAIQFLKQSPWCPFLKAESDKLNIFVSWLMAFVSSLGIVASMNGHLSLDSGATITLAIPSLSQIADTLMHTVGQFGIQQGIYQGIVKQPQEPKP